MESINKSRKGAYTLCLQVHAIRRFCVVHMRHERESMSLITTVRRWKRSDEELVKEVDERINDIVYQECMDCEDKIEKKPDYLMEEELD